MAWATERPYVRIIVPLLDHLPPWINGPRNSVNQLAYPLPYLSFMWRWVARITTGLSLTAFVLLMIALGTLVAGGAWLLLRVLLQ